MILDMLKKKFAGRAGQAGESLGEVLVAMTVAGLAMIMLAMAISVSTNIVSTSDQVEKDYYSGNSTLINMSINNGSVEVAVDGESSGTSIKVKYGVQEDIPGMQGDTAVAYEATELKEG